MYEDKTYSSLLQDALSDVGGGVQTGEGYLVYNALSALAYELEKLYIQMDYIISIQVFREIRCLTDFQR